MADSEQPEHAPIADRAELLKKMRAVPRDQARRYRQVDSGDGMDGRNDHQRRQDDETRKR